MTRPARKISDGMIVAVLTGIFAIIVALIGIVPNLQPAAAPTPTPTTISFVDMPTGVQINFLDTTATEIMLQRTVDAKETATEAILQRTVVAQGVINATLLAENTRIAQTSTLTASPSPTTAYTSTSPPPRSTSGLVVGGQARVRLAAGYNIFDVRSAPAWDGLVRAELLDGAIVTILDGPVAADNSLWWRVRTSDGIEGWAVESLSGSQQALIPIAETATPASTATPLMPTTTVSLKGYPCDGQIVSHSSALLNVVRANPSDNAPLRNLIRQGITVRILASSGETRTKIWHQIADPSGDYLGWIPAEYIILSEDCPT